MSTQERPESGPGDVARSRQVEGAESEPNPSVAMAEIRRGSPVPLGKFTPGSDEWVEVRKTHLGGSEIAAVLGLSPWTSPFSLWHTKAGLIPPTPDSPAMEWGRRLEPVVAAKFCDMHPDFIPLPNSFQGSTFAHHERSWQSASPDLRLTYPTAEYVDGGATFVEIKTSARADAWYDGVPVYYRTQVLWTMDVLGVDTPTSPCSSAARTTANSCSSWTTTRRQTWPSCGQPARTSWHRSPQGRRPTSTTPTQPSKPFAASLPTSTLTQR
jgi:putative phage-type endonuclease